MMYCCRQKESDSTLESKLDQMMQDFKKEWDQATSNAEAAEETFGPDGETSD